MDIVCIYIYMYIILIRFIYIKCYLNKFPEYPLGYTSIL